MDNQEKKMIKNNRTDEEWNNIFPVISTSLNDLLSFWDLDAGETIVALTIYIAEYAHSIGLNIKDFEENVKKIIYEVYKINESSNKSDSDHLEKT